jgi:hypothetical protein
MKGCAFVKLHLAFLNIFGPAGPQANLVVVFKAEYLQIKNILKT